MVFEQSRLLCRVAHSPIIWGPWDWQHRARAGLWFSGGSMSLSHPNIRLAGPWAELAGLTWKEHFALTSPSALAKWHVTCGNTELDPLCPAHLSSLSIFHSVDGWKKGERKEMDKVKLGNGILASVFLFCHTHSVLMPFLFFVQERREGRKEDDGR